MIRFYNVSISREINSFCYLNNFAYEIIFCIILFNMFDKMINIYVKHQEFYNICREYFKCILRNLYVYGGCMLNVFRACQLIKLVEICINNICNVNIVLGKVQEDSNINL